MIQPPNQGMSVVNVVQACTDLSRALDGSHGAVTPDGVDDRGPKPVTVREALTQLSRKISLFLATPAS